MNEKQDEIIVKLKFEITRRNYETIITLYYFAMQCSKISWYTLLLYLIVPLR